MSYIIQNFTDYSELSDFLLDYVHETGFMIMSVQHTHCSTQFNNFLSALYIQIIWEQAFSI